MDENTNITQHNIGNVETHHDKQPDISVSDAITGVITEPAVTFEAVKFSSKKNYWLLPTLILVVITVAASLLVTQDEELYSEIKTKQTDAVKKNLEKNVKDGKMTQEQMNEAMEKVEKGFDRSGAFFIAITVLGPVFSIFIILLLKSLIYWGVLKIFKGAAGFAEILCVTGLISVITSLQTIVDTAIAIFTGRLQANIGPGLIFDAETIGESMMTFLSHFDLISIWALIVLGIGLAKVSNLKTGISQSVVFGLWLIWVLVTSFVRIPFFAA